MFDFEEESAFPLESSLRKLDVEVRVGDFSLTNELTLGTISGSAKLVLSVSKKGLYPTLLSLVPCVSVKTEKKHRGICGTKFVAMDLGSNCLDLASMSNKPGADWTTEKEIDLSLVDPPSDKFSGILADIISILWNPFDFSTPNLVDDSGRYSTVMMI